MGCIPLGLKIRFQIGPKFRTRGAGESGCKKQKMRESVESHHLTLFNSTSQITLITIPQFYTLLFSFSGFCPFFCSTLDSYVSSFPVFILNVKKIMHEQILILHEFSQRPVWNLDACLISMYIIIKVICLKKPVASYIIFLYFFPS